MNDSNKYKDVWFSSSVTTVTRGRTVPDSINRYMKKLRLSDGYINKIQFIKKQDLVMDKEMEYFYITAAYEFRPDLLSNDVYDSPLYAWAILAANDMKSIFDFKIGMSVKVPSFAEVSGGLK